MSASISKYKASSISLNNTAIGRTDTDSTLDLFPLTLVFCCLGLSHVGSTFCKSVLYIIYLNLEVWEHRDLTYVSKHENKVRHQEVAATNHAPLLSGLQVLCWGKKSAVLETLQGVWNFAGHEASTFLWPCSKPFSASNSGTAVLLSSLLRQAHELAFGNSISSILTLCQPCLKFLKDSRKPSIVLHFI